MSTSASESRADTPGEPPGDTPPPGAVVPDDCTSCGRCCFSQQADYIAVFEVDRQRMDASALAHTVIIDGRRFMRFAEGRCAALELADGRYTCAVYPMRPDACRWLERGSGECVEQIAQKREIALIALRRSGA